MIFASGGSVPTNYLEPRWYAAYTCARHEKTISRQLAQRGMEQFLPIYETVRRWKDRKVRVQLPLFPSYIFVHVALRDQLKVLQIPGVVRLVSFNGHPTALPEDEMLALRKGLSSGVSARPHPYLHLAMGRFVRVKSGPLSGLTGKLVRRKGNCRIVISIQSIMRSISAEISLDDIDIPLARDRALARVPPETSRLDSKPHEPEVYL
jgi:transcription antitermination factor NusG